MATDTLKITGADVGTLDLTGSEYSIAAPGYRPGPGRRRGDELGGGLYAVVEDVIPLNIQGSSKANVKSLLDDLVSALDQAARWSKHENVNAVLLEWDADGGGNPLKTTILGPVAGGMADLLGNYRIDLDDFIIGPIEVKILRSSSWLAAEESVSSSATTNPEKMTATFADSPDIDSPLELRLEADNWPALIAFKNPDMTVLVASASDKLVIDNCNALGGVDFSTFNDSGNNPRSGTNVLRYTPTTTQDRQAIKAISINSGVRLVAVYMNFRSSISAVTWYVNVRLQGKSMVTPYTPVLTIPGADILTNPKYYFMGIISCPVAVDTFVFQARASTTTGSPVLDSDVFAILALDDPTSRAVFIGAVDQGAGYSPNPPWLYRIKHNELEEPSPSIELWRGAIEARLYPSRKGDPYLLTRGTTVVCSVLATDANDWVYMNDDTPTDAKVQFIANARRRKAYLFPQ